jgi:hypothetical protein
MKLISTMSAIATGFKAHPLRVAFSSRSKAAALAFARPGETTLVCSGTIWDGGFLMAEAANAQINFMISHHQLKIMTHLMHAARSKLVEQRMATPVEEWEGRADEASFGAIVRQLIDGYKRDVAPMQSAFARPDLSVTLKRTVAVTATQKRKLMVWAEEASHRERLKIGISEIVRRLIDLQAVFVFAPKELTGR